MSLHNACQCRRAGPATLAHYLLACRLQQRLDSDFMRDDMKYRVAQVLLTALFNTVFCCLKSGTDLVYLFTFVWYLTHDYINCAVKQFNFSNRGVIIIHKLFITCDHYAVNGCARSKESFYLLHVLCQLSPSRSGNLGTICARRRYCIRQQQGECTVQHRQPNG